MSRLPLPFLFGALSYKKIRGSASARQICTAERWREQFVSLGKYCAIIIIMVNLKSHIHTKIRKKFSKWLLPIRRIHIEFVVEPKIGVIKEVLAELGETPVLSIYTESKWFERPVLELSHDVVQFFAQFDTEIILDINY